ncbi:hypothetical protein MXB_1599, partial [Myxobolus squamalis]
MREILHLQVGQCGNQVGNRFWEKILEEHSLDFEGRYHGTNEMQKRRLSVYFNETNETDRFVPRSILIDLEPGTMDSI